MLHRKKRREHFTHIDYRLFLGELTVNTFANILYINTMYKGKQITNHINSAYKWNIHKNKC